MSADDDAPTRTTHTPHRTTGHVERSRPGRRRGWRAAAVPLVAGALVASACGGDDEEDPGAGFEAATTTSTAPPAPEDLQLEEGAAPLADVQFALTEVFQADTPTAVVTRPESELLYVAEKGGTVRSVTVTGEGPERTYEVSDEPILDITDSVETGGEEQGLLDITFSADGSTLYVHYSLAGSGDTRIDAFTMDGDTAAADSGVEILAVEQPYENHNGGDIELGPDGFLWVALGDGGDAGDPEGNGQDTEALLGKILRIDPAGSGGGGSYGIPADNPFAGGGGAPEVWLYGVRNPWRIAFDPATEDLWVADVGQQAWEEINLLPTADGRGAGANLGWNVREGLHPYEGGELEGAVDPVFEYSHAEGCSITGGVVYRGPSVPALDGAYLFGDYCNGALRAIRVVDGATSEQRTFEELVVPELTSFGVDNAGDVYAISLGGSISRIDAAA